MFVSTYGTEEDDINKSVQVHGDAVKDVAFEVEDLDHIMKHAKTKGAVVVKDIWEESDEFGTVKMAIIKTVIKCIFLISHKNNGRIEKIYSRVN